MKKILCLTLVFTLFLVSANVAFAEKGKVGKISKPERSTLQQQEKKQGLKADKVADNLLKEQLKSQKIQLEHEKDALEAEKDSLELKKDLIEKELEAALENGDESQVTELKAKLEEAKTQFSEMKKQMKVKLAERKQLIREQYTTQELSAIDEASKNILNSDQTIRVLDVTSILSSNKKFKFDTPPVIKGNRTLIPVRAITEGLGAEVKWDATTNQVTIMKDQTSITLTLGSSTALVNGVEVKLDTNASSMNKRTYVPLRFIMETFKMQVSYEDGTIEIDEQPDSDITTDGTTTDGTTTDGTTTDGTTTDGTATDSTTTDSTTAE